MSLEYNHTYRHIVLNLVILKIILNHFLKHKSQSVYITFPIKMKVIFVLLLRFYTICKNIRTHIKCKEEKLHKA